MSLDALAPDQRAVVQLVLQQDRSYEDLAALLGITPAAVRERAQRGLDRLSPPDAVPDYERAEIADYLLGQQSVSAREATRGLLSRSEPARAWALAVASELAGVARATLPEVPGAAVAAEPEPFVADAGPFVPDEPSFADPLAEEPAPTRARPRPRHRAEETAVSTTPDFGFGEPEPRADEDGEPFAVDKASRLGGALLIAGLGIFVAALIVWLVTRGDDTSTEKDASTASETTVTATPSPSGTPDYQPLASLPLRAPDGGESRGTMVVYVAANTGSVAFNIRGRNVPATERGQAYGVWVTGGDKPHFLGFAPAVDDDGKFAVSGPRDSDAQNFPVWLSDAKQVVVSTETEEGGTRPGSPVILEGSISQAKKPAGAAATPTP